VLIEPDYQRSANPGVAITYGHTVTNTGNASDTFTITAFSDQGFTVNPNPLSIMLAPGGSGPVTVRITFPSTATSGVTDTTTIRATSANAPAVFDTAIDQTRLNRVAVEIAPNLTSTASPGDTVMYAHTITNLGDIADTFNLAFNSSQGFSVNLGSTSVNLGPGDSALLTVTVAIPITAVDGITDTTTITATSSAYPHVFDTATDATQVNIVTSFILNAADGDQLVSLGWNSPGNPVSHTVQYAANSGPWQPLTTTLGAADRYYHTPATNGQTYDYRVLAYYADSTIGFSNVASATPGVISNKTTVACTSILSVTVGLGTTPPTCKAALIDIDAPGINPPASLFLGTVIVGDPDRPGELILDYGAGGGIIDGSDYDVVFFELFNRTFSPPAISLDYTILEVSETYSPSNWITVFGWDGVDGHVTNTNIASYGPTGTDEVEGEQIPPLSLYPDPSPATPPNENTGIAIDISPYAPAGIKYRYIRLAQPASGSPGTQVQVDAIYRLN